MKYKLILGGRKKYESLILYLNRENIKYIIFDALDDDVEKSSFIKNIIYLEYKYFFDANYYYNFLIENNISVDQVINFRDQEKWVKLENDLNRLLNLNLTDEATLKFFTHKSHQDSICKELLIPTVGLDKSKKLIVKKDSGYSGGTGFYISDFTNISNFDNIFLQNYIDIEYTIAAQCYIDNSNNWYILNYHKILYNENCPERSISPYFGIEISRIKKYIRLLKSKIHVKNRIIFWQFIKEKNGSLFNMDFNCRPAGGFEAGSYDSDISNNNWLDYYINGVTPSTITFNAKVEVLYKNKKLFGYSDYERHKTNTNEFTYKVEKI